jgi:3-isopropylmalate dehydrogenase
VSHSSKPIRVAVLPGDGIGREVMVEAIRVLRALEADSAELRFDLHEHPCGAGAYRELGDPLPPGTLAACREADAILLGAMGLPNVRWPDGREMAPQIDLREQLDLYCGLRPIYLYHAGDSPLKRRQAGEIDLLIVRENTEGLFSSRLNRTAPGASQVEDTLRITRHASERLFRAAFEHSRRRRGRVTLVDKANVLPSMVFFRAIFDEVAAEYPGAGGQSMSMRQHQQRPHSFDVLVTENMFGDILSISGRTRRWHGARPVGRYWRPSFSRHGTALLPARASRIPSP